MRSFGLQHSCFLKSRTRKTKKVSFWRHSERYWTRFCCTHQPEGFWTMPGIFLKNMQREGQIRVCGLGGGTVSTDLMVRILPPAAAGPIIKANPPESNSNAKNRWFRIAMQFLEFSQNSFLESNPDNPYTLFKKINGVTHHPVHWEGGAQKSMLQQVVWTIPPQIWVLPPPSHRIAFAITCENCRKHPFARNFHSKNEVFAVSFAKPFAFASECLPNASFAAF